MLGHKDATMYDEIEALGQWHTWEKGFYKTIPSYSPHNLSTKFQGFNKYINEEIKISEGLISSEYYNECYRD